MKLSQYAKLANRTLPEKEICLTTEQQGYVITAYQEIHNIVNIIEPIKKHVFHGHDIENIKCYKIEDGVPFPDLDTKRINMAIGLVGEACEAALKILEAEQVADIGDELGDVLWYINGCANTCGLQLDEIASYNVHKLKKRYPNGFDQHDSINRAENK